MKLNINFYLRLLKNYMEAKQYLIKNLTSKKQTLPSNFYETFSALYREYPNLIEDLINIIPNSRSYSDLLNILRYGDNIHVDNIIYNVLAERFKKDIELLKDDNTPSTLVRYLPNEKTVWSKNIGFIDHLMSRIYPRMSINKKMQTYRDYRSRINEHIGTIRNYEGRFKDLDFSKMSFKTLLKNYNRFLQGGCEKKVRYEIMERLNRTSMPDFIDILLNNEDPFITEICNSIWPTYYKDFCLDFEFPDMFNHTLILALSNPTTDQMHFALGLALAFSEKKLGIMIYNGEAIYVFRDSQSPSEFIRYLTKKFVDPFDKINFKNIQELQLFPEEQYVLISDTNTSNAYKYLNIKWNVSFDSEVMHIVDDKDNEYLECVNPIYSNVKKHRKDKMNAIINLIETSDDFDYDLSLAWSVNTLAFLLLLIMFFSAACLFKIII